MPIALGIAITAFTAVISAACFWKYAHFWYTGFDLAIIHQTFWNTARGDWFAQTIHPNSYLGDHAELAVVILAQIYRLWQDPRMLLVMQALALGLAAWPLWKIARLRIGPKDPVSWHGVTMAGLIAAAWLLSPAAQNAALFEFHLVPFAIAPIFFALLAYERGEKRAFVLWAIAALLAREDVALVIGSIGILAWMEKKPKWWIFAPVALGAAWMIGALALVSAFAPAGSYKFFHYYGWLREGIAHPITLARHLVSITQIEMVVGLLMPLLFLPLGAPRRLIMALGPFLQIALTASGGGALIFQTHYGLLFLPGLFLAAIEGIKMVPAAHARFAAVLLAIGAVFAAMTLGPLPGVIRMMVHDRTALEAERRHAEEIIAKIPSDAAVAAGYRLMPALSGRAELYALHYQFLGVTYGGETPYAIPDDVRFVALDRRDAAVYEAQYRNISWAAGHLAGGEERLKAFVGTPVFASGPYVLYDREPGATSIDLAQFKAESGIQSEYQLNSIRSPALISPPVPRPR